MILIVPQSIQNRGGVNTPGAGVSVSARQKDFKTPRVWAAITPDYQITRALVT